MKTIIVSILITFCIVCNLGCVSPSPESNAPVNIRVFCGEKEEITAPDIKLEQPSFPSPPIEEQERFWYYPSDDMLITPGIYPGTYEFITPNAGPWIYPPNTTTESLPMCCGKPWPGGSHDSICTMICSGDTIDFN